MNSRTEKYRNVVLYKQYCTSFLRDLEPVAKEKILWTLMLIEQLESIPAPFFRSIKGYKGLYEIRIRSESNTYRIFCFFGQRGDIILINGFQKKSAKAPLKEIAKARRLQKEYQDEEEHDNSE